MEQDNWPTLMLQTILVLRNHNILFLYTNICTITRSVTNTLPTITSQITLQHVDTFYNKHNYITYNTQVCIYFPPYLVSQTTSNGSALSQTTNIMSDCPQGHHSFQNWICRNLSIRSKKLNAQFRHSSTAKVKHNRQTDRQTLELHDDDISHFRKLPFLQPINMLSVCVRWLHMLNQQTVSTVQRHCCSAALWLWLLLYTKLGTVMFCFIATKCVTAVRLGGGGIEIQTNCV